MGIPVEAPLVLNQVKARKINVETMVLIAPAFGVGAKTLALMGKLENLVEGREQTDGAVGLAKAQLNGYRNITDLLAENEASGASRPDAKVVYVIAVENDTKVDVAKTREVRSRDGSLPRFQFLGDVDHHSVLHAPTVVLRDFSLN